MKNILILGGTSDIGIAISKKFAHEKFGVSLAGRNRSYMSRVSSDIQIRENAEVRLFEFDALSFRDHRLFYQSLDIKPDVCACVFGYLGDQKRGAADWNEAEKIIDVNYKGAVSILNVIAEEFGSRGHGTIIGISSVGGDRGRQSNFLYGSAKAGLTAYLSGLRNQLFNKGVHVVTVKPGFVNTRMTEGLDLPPALTAQADQVAAAVYSAYVKKKDVVYVLPIWRFVMWVIKCLPEFVFKRLKL